MGTHRVELWQYNISWPFFTLYFFLNEKVTKVQISLDISHLLFVFDIIVPMSMLQSENNLSSDAPNSILDVIKFDKTHPQEKIYSLQ